MNIEDHMVTISEAARYVRARLPRSNPIDLQDLVQVGAERVLRYMGSREGEMKTLVFICAKAGMLDEAYRHRSIVRPRDRKTKVVDDPASYPIHRWARHTEYDIEFMLDLKRELLRMPLRQAASWYSRHVLDEPVGTLGPEFGVSRGMVCLYEIAARKRLRAVMEAGEAMRDSAARIYGTATLRRGQVERQRYAELRRQGASVQHATRGAKSTHCYAQALRQLTAEATE